MLRHDIERGFRRAVHAFGGEIIVPAVLAEHVNVGLSHGRVGEPPDAKKLIAISRVGVIVLAPGDGLGFTAHANSRVCTHRRCFAKLPAGTVDALLKDIPKLKAILTYHVVSGAVMAKDVKTGMVPTVNGQSLNVKADAMGITVTGAKVTTADVKASNGVIHVIDTVLLPK